MERISNYFKGIHSADFVSVTKSCNMDEMDRLIKYNYSYSQKFKVVAVYELIKSEMVEFKKEFFVSYGWLGGEDMTVKINKENIAAAILVRCGEECFIVDHRGCGYPRYIARL